MNVGRFKIAAHWFLGIPNYSQQLPPVPKQTIPTHYLLQ